MMPIADSLRAVVEHVDHTRVGRKLSNADLAELQALLYRLITSAEGPAGLFAGHDLHAFREVITGDDRMTAPERLEIYGRAYFSRIDDALKKDFPATFGTIGAVGFHDLVVGYLAEYPPTEPSISHAGRYLPDFLRTHPLRKKWPFIADLALLERMLLEVFQAADAEVLKIETMRRIPPTRWPNFSVKTVPALALVDCEWRVDELLRDFEADPVNYRAVDAMIAKEPITVIIWRKNSDLHYRAAEAVERKALMLARSGALLASIYEVAAGSWGGIAQEDAVERLTRLMAQWIEDGLLAPDNSPPQ